MALISEQIEGSCRLVESSSAMISWLGKPSRIPLTTAICAARSATNTRQYCASGGVPVTGDWSGLVSRPNVCWRRITSVMRDAVMTDVMTAANLVRWGMSLRIDSSRLFACMIFFAGASAVAGNLAPNRLPTTA